MQQQRRRHYSNNNTRLCLVCRFQRGGGGLNAEREREGNGTVSKAAPAVRVALLWMKRVKKKEERDE